MTKSTTYLTFNSIIKTLCVILMLLINHQAFADATLTYKTSNGDYRFQLKNKQLFINNIDRDTDLVYDQAADHAIVIQHQKKNYLLLNETELQRLNQQVSGLKSSITANLSSEQRAQLNDFLGGALGTEQTKTTNYALKDNGGAQVGNFLCQQYQVLENGKASGAICTSSSQQININPTDYNTLMAFQRFAIKASNILRDSIGSTAQIQLPDLSKTPVNGFLIFSKIENQSDADFYLLNTDQKPVTTNFSIPTNYQRGSVSAATLIR